jgi:Domain of unknown function (DUF4338)/Transposase DNA-binding
VLDAVRIAGRWVAQAVLDRLSARSRSDKPPLRRQLVRDFCRATHWRNRKGELSLSSANVALNGLEKQGLVKLTPPGRRSLGVCTRQLVDDGKALPALPQLPKSLQGTDCLHLQLLSGADDPDHLLWNRLICRHHPLKAAPLVGAQLRYLIRSEQGVIGAFGFGPAAFHLACRDRWIGWEPLAQRQNLPLVIGLSRFLIRPGLRCANLASRCYSLVLKRVGPDWQQRYGIKPVLVETFVDRSTHAGVSLSAANWRRLGQSSGRGRSSPSAKIGLQTAKDVWVVELTPKARQQLQAQGVEAVAPRSIFQPMASAAGWAEQELDGLKLGDRRLERRLVQMLGSRWQHPERSFGASFSSPAAGKAAYRLIENPQVGLCFQNLLAPHRQQTHRRMAAESVVVLAQDTTTLSYNTLLHTEGLGPVGDARHPGRGLWLHGLHAYRLDRIPLGCAWARLWARPNTSDTDQRNEQSLCDKESERWIEAYQASVPLARAMPQTQLVVCSDRESDIFELYDQTEVAPKNWHVLVRAQHDRLLETGHSLWQSLSQQASGGRMRVKVPRHQEHPARVATLEVKWTRIEVSPPRVALKKSWKPIALYAVMAREVQPPAGVEPIRWVLLTDWPVDSLKLARRMIQWYGLRWGIECWHQVLKDVCRVETREMKSARALERALALDMMVAWRAQFLCRLGKQSPNLPASLYYSEEELAVLDLYKSKLPQWVESMPLTAVPEPPNSVERTEHSQPLSQPQTKLPGGDQVVKVSGLKLIQANL